MEARRSLTGLSQVHMGPDVPPSHMLMPPYEPLGSLLAVAALRPALGRECRSAASNAVRRQRLQEEYSNSSDFKVDLCRVF